MDLLKSMMVAASGLKAQSGRMRIIAENIANADSTATKPGGDPYRRKIPTFQDRLDRSLGTETVQLGRPVLDKADFQMKYMPGHPAADANGYVKMPNVNGLVEAMDMKEAQRSYEANLNLIQASRRMISQTIDILKR
ncbi:flagellar basal body rod protein FlgC [Parvibaculum sedimenti]|uniref:Flagellar basal-body rod protein FlgC n=1 Tax=Parvibaculum sedimenti TaxID=2608632 RepID=A0A6N6VEE2_9HYPH|nr:flagellar basal body rod protein FlgC [Parvibaculum sedimenti]KAB7739090.1 flagellar basal body rod protein FlgC [Parvibaculum sedimenti]